ncbi:hypothetical protein [Longimicrobium sp.]|uniref:hypothetical protein n=1 Tax=Longimicrobium sp. TaxID=2029185 RepID=UPI002C004FF5|nr:hypothetical protein [Longimicrobium sp.]HSU15424.1 hypothetical protein [Longimicrobium sp.]
MNRSALALLGLLALPLAASAQDRPLLANEPPPERLPESRISVMPYIGARVPYTTGDVVLFTQGGDQFRIATQRGGGPMLGVDVMARVRGPINVVGGVAYSGKREDVLRFQDLQADSSVDVTTDGPRYWMAKAGVVFRLADPEPDNRHFHPSAFITVAPALVWVDYDDVSGFPDAANKSTTNFALNLGADASARIGRTSRWAFTIGLQDFLTFWNTDSMTARDVTIGEALTGEPVVIDYDYNTSNIFTLRFGVSYRIR